MVARPPSEFRDLEQQRPPMIGPRGYANPAEPIRIALVRDEEAAGIESEATKFPPPAYGLWRESVVCFSGTLLDMKLMRYSEWIRTESFGNATKRLRVSVRDLWAERNELQLQIGLHPTFPRMASTMSLKRNRDRSLPPLMFLFHHILLNRDDYCKGRRDSIRIGFWSDIAYILSMSLMFCIW